MSEVYHLRAYPSFEDATTERVSKLRNDAADIEHGNSFGPKTSESIITERE